MQGCFGKNCIKNFLRPPYTLNSTFPLHTQRMSSMPGPSGPGWNWFQARKTLKNGPHHHHQHHCSQLAKDFSRPPLVIRSHKNILSLIFTNKSALQNIPKLEAGWQVSLPGDFGLDPGVGGDAEQLLLGVRTQADWQQRAMALKVRQRPWVPPAASVLAQTGGPTKPPPPPPPLPSISHAIPMAPRGTVHPLIIWNQDGDYYTRQALVIERIPVKLGKCPGCSAGSEKQEPQRWCWSRRNQREADGPAGTLGRDRQHQAFWITQLGAVFTGWIGRGLVWYFVICMIWRRNAI